MAALPTGADLSTAFDRHDHLLAHDQPHDLAAPFTLDRFKRLDFILEAGTTTVT